MNLRPEPDEEEDPSSAYSAVKQAGRDLNWNDGTALPKPSGDEKEHRRGDYRTFNIGWSMGCGSKVSRINFFVFPKLTRPETCAFCTH